LLDAFESTNRVKKGVIKELFSEIGFFVKKGSYMTLQAAKIWGKSRKREKDRKNPKIMVDD